MAKTNKIVAPLLICGFLLVLLQVMGQVLSVVKSEPASITEKELPVTTADTAKAVSDSLWEETEFSSYH